MLSVDCNVVILFHLTDGKVGSAMKLDPVHVFLEALHETCLEKHTQAVVVIVGKMA